MSFSVGTLSFLNSAISRLLRRKESKAKVRLSTNHPSRFRVEPLEPRILLSSELLPQPDPAPTSEEQNDGAIVLIQEQSFNENSTIELAAWNSQPTETRNLAPGSSDLQPSAPDALSSDRIKPVVDEAVDQLSNLGFSAEQLEQARRAEIRIVDLPGWTLAEASEERIKIDSNANGFEWYIDLNPDDNAEFLQQGSELHAVAGSEAEGRVDLLTVLTHELGHYLGLKHSDGSDAATAFMQPGIRPGTRRITSDVSEPQVVS